jgi:hypothetical protein
LTLFHLSLILAVVKKRRKENMAALDKATDIRTRLNGLFEKIEEVRGFL